MDANGNQRRTADKSTLSMLAESAVTRLASRAALLIVGSMIAWSGFRMIATIDNLSRDATILSTNVAVIATRLEDHGRRLIDLERNDRRSSRGDIERPGIRQ